jgi:hypothetical protein
MSSRLADLQRLLYRLITAPGGVEEAVAGDSALRERGLETLIGGNPRLSAAERLGIYSNAYFYRLHDVLKEDFSCTYKVLGDVDFHNLVTGYLIEYPPSEPSIHDAGRHLPQYLHMPANHEDSAISQLPFLSNLASLERACIEVFHCSDAKVLTQESLRGLTPESWPSLAIRLHPAARILDVDWRVDESMAAIKDGRQWELPERAAATILVWRQDWQVRYRALERGERGALKAAIRGSDFATICTELINGLESASNMPDPAAIVNRMFTAWVRDGLLVNTVEQPSPP